MEARTQHIEGKYKVNTNSKPFDTAKAAEIIVDELRDAARRLDLGEPMATTAAELGLTPRELVELLAYVPR